MEREADLETAKMFALVGRAISQWSLVELSLCNIFTVCVTSCPSRSTPDGGFVSFLDGDVPSAIFYSIENFRSKLGLVDAALRARVSENARWAEAIRNEWAKLFEKTRKSSLKRNMLAHWTVTPALPDDEEGIHPSQLMPPYGSPAWWKETGLNPDGKAKSAKEIEDCLHSFSLIDEKLRQFHRTLAQHPEMIGKYDQLLVRLIRSHDRLSPARGRWVREQIAFLE